MNEGAQQRYEAMGVPAEMWITAKDDLTCPFCRSMDGTIIMTKDDFLAPGQQLEVEVGSGKNTKIRRMRAHEGMGIRHPPLHPHGRCGLKPIVDMRQIEKN